MLKASNVKLISDYNSQRFTSFNNSQQVLQVELDREKSDKAHNYVNYRFFK